MVYQRELAVAIDAVIKASALCDRVQQSLAGAALSKGDKSPVTVADFGAQAVVSADLFAAFPQDPLVGEEDADMLRLAENAHMADQVVENVAAINSDLDREKTLTAIDRGTYEGGPSGRHWTLDPIDGTKGFLRGDQYAVALALIEDGEVVLGVLGCPNLPYDMSHPDGTRGSLFFAVKGQGAFMMHIGETTHTPIRVSRVGSAKAAAFVESVEKGHTNQSHSARVAQRLGIEVPPVRIDSQCKYSVVARGEAAIYLRLPTRPGYEEKIWDHAAGVIVVEEAGGVVTDVNGKPLDFSIGRTLRDNKGVIVTNGEFHSEVLAAVRAVLE
jgi:3'(2'), 5'-bisphosphate nucleotidase